MRKVKKSILEACHGAILDIADNELEKVMANINDINTDPKKRRTIDIKLVFQPNQDRSKIAMTAQVKSKIEPLVPTETTLFNVQEKNDKTGEVVNVLRELTGEAPGQLNVFGDISEPEVFLIGANASRVIEIENEGLNAKGEE